ncbi:ott 1508-like deaminase [Stemphylium lycopersici]|nr:ott 1508-like deaminase [Stemphylium lycopersici]
MGEANIPPSDPRAVREGKEKIRKVEETTLYPRISLYELLTKWKSEDEPRKRSEGDSKNEARRHFLDSFAYLCDVEKGGKTVTAAALRSLPNSDETNLLLAANEGIRDEVLRYAKNILSQLKSMPEEDIVQTLRKKLKILYDTQKPLPTEKYIDICFEMRREELQGIRGRSTEPNDDFCNLSHYIWRIGATREKANRVVKAMDEDRSLRHISSEIETIKAPVVKEMVLDSRYMNPHEILHDIYNDSKYKEASQAEKAFLRLYQLDPAGERPIYTEMVSAKRSRVVTRVHAELQVADVFSRRQHYKFVADDKYIGCSKPACYFCYEWFSTHKHGYVRPATHGKIILGCRGPDHELNETGAEVILNMYKGISRQIGQHIFEFLCQKLPERSGQYMSTEAETRATSHVSLG